MWAWQWFNLTDLNPNDKRSTLGLRGVSMNFNEVANDPSLTNNKEINNYSTDDYNHDKQEITEYTVFEQNIK